METLNTMEQRLAALESSSNSSKRTVERSANFVSFMRITEILQVLLRLGTTEEELVATYNYKKLMEVKLAEQGYNGDIDYIKIIGFLNSKNFPYVSKEQGEIKQRILQLRAERKKEFDERRMNIEEKVDL
jgi:hypothetical protein